MRKLPISSASFQLLQSKRGAAVHTLPTRQERRKRSRQRVCCESFAVDAGWLCCDKMVLCTYLFCWQHFEQHRHFFSFTCCNRVFLLKCKIPFKQQRWCLLPKTLGSIPVSEGEVHCVSHASLCWKAGSVLESWFHAGKLLPCCTADEN